MLKIQVIGIDPGVSTGFARVNTAASFAELCTLSMYYAQDRILQIAEVYGVESVLVCIEDCRLRKWVDPKLGKERLRGIGSVERDCSLWQEFCELHGLRFELVAPRGIATKMDKWAFAQTFDYPYDTSNHARDAGTLARKYHRMLRTGEYVMPALTKPKIKKYPSNRKLPKKPDKKVKDKPATAVKKPKPRNHRARGRQSWK